MAIEKPNYTQVPNSLFELMPLMGDAELRCTLALVRKIIGYHKQTDPMSYSQFMHATGLSRQGVRNGLKDATERGVVRIVGSGKQGIKRYTLNFVGDESQLVNQVDQSTTLTETSLPSRHTKERKKEIDPNGSTAKPKKPRQRSEKQLALDAMKNALADAFGLDRDKVTGTKWNEFGKAGKELIEAGATPEEMKPLHAWCKAKKWENFSSIAMSKEYAHFATVHRKLTRPVEPRQSDIELDARDTLLGGG